MLSSNGVNKRFHFLINGNFIDIIHVFGHLLNRSQKTVCQQTPKKCTDDKQNDHHHCNDRQHSLHDTEDTACLCSHTQHIAVIHAHSIIKCRFCHCFRLTDSLPFSCFKCRLDFLTVAVVFHATDIRIGIQKDLAFFVDNRDTKVIQLMHFLNQRCLIICIHTGQNIGVCSHITKNLCFKTLIKQCRHNGCCDKNGQSCNQTKLQIYFVLHLFSAHGLLILLIRHNIADISNRLDHRTGLTEFFT